MHLPNLIEDLALILGAAAIITLIFKRLKQPLVLGYILAGLLVGPNFPFLPSVTDLEGVRIWSEIGVIFLLFSLGLEFSFKKLMRVGGTAGIAGIFEISMMLVLGFVAGRLLGWSFMDSIFLGGIMAISSTTIILRAFSELGVKNRKFASLVLGILVVEDVVAVLLLVLLSTLAVSQQFSGTELLFAVGKLLFFLCLWFLAGIFLLPSLLRWSRKLFNEETLLVVSIALCFLMVVLATKVGFSAALGAFIMGSILAETREAEKIETLTKSVKDLFAAIFFVSVGMLIDLAVLVDYAIPVFLLVLLVIFGKTINVTIGALISGQPLRQSMQAGMSLSQIGEFSFIIATLGVSLNVTSTFLYPIAVGVSVITTFTTPLMIKMADPLYNFLEKRLPAKWRKTLDQYSTGALTIQAESDWKIVIRSYVSIIIVNSVFLLAFVLLASTYLAPFIDELIGNHVWSTIITVIVALSAMAPFLWALSVKKISSNAYSNLWLDKKYNRGPLVVLEVFRNILAIVFMGLLLDRLLSFPVAMGTTLLFMLIVGLIFRNRLQSFYQRLEGRFLDNLNDRDKMDNSGSGSSLSPWDAHMAYFEVSPDAHCAGKNLQTLAWREKFGINIASIERGLKTITAPGRLEVIYPYDKLSVIGTDQQLQVFRQVVEPAIAIDGVEDEEISLHKVIVDEHNHLRGKSIRDSHIREATHGLVVGIERATERILNPDSAVVFEWNDVVWIVGNKKLILDLNTD